MIGVLIITLIVIFVVEILIFRQRYPTWQERVANRQKLFVVQLVTVAVFIIVALSAARSSSASSSTTGQEYGLFNRKKTVVVKTERTNYGNPMKKQDYIPRNAVRVMPKTDASKIYIKA